MIRLALLAIGFVAVTIALLVFQPGNGRRAEPETLPDVVVTRAEPAIGPAASAPETAALGLAQTQPLARPAPADLSVGDEELRRLTWSTLSNLNHATGRDSAPGQPGSLLHTIVRRSLDDGGASAPLPAQGGSPTTYVVQAGDSLVSIAEALYGDVNMTGPLFAANQSLLARPDDLRPGQVLVLPGF